MEILNVFFGQHKAGCLTLNKDRSFSFQYDPQWLKSPQGFQLSVSLPLQESAVSGQHVREFFANLLPESGARTRIAHRLGLSEKNDFMLLKELGGDCAGAISLLPEARQPESPALYAYEPVNDRQLGELIRQIPLRPLLAGEQGVRISLAGAQEKLALFKKDNTFYIPLNGAPSTCILKPEMSTFDFSIENECFCMMLARDLSLSVPRVRILVRENQKALVIDRYDRVFRNGAAERLHQEDFCQAMGLSHELKYQAEGGPGLKACFALVREYSVNPVKDFQFLLKWVFFNFLIGNMDGHAKNLSFLYQNRQIRLAPFYDLLCTDIYDGLSKKLAMKIGRENRPDWVMERHWEGLASDIKIAPKVLKKHLTTFCIQMTDTLETTLSGFSREYGENDLVLTIAKASHKRAATTLARLAQ